MYTAQGPGGIFYSAVAQEPDMHPLIELGASMAPYAAAAYGVSYLASQRYPNSEYTYFDTTLKTTRNVLNKFPMGFLNTFRLAELGSYKLTGAALGLEKATSVVDDEVNVRRQVFGKEYFNEDTLKAFKGALSPQEFQSVSADMQRGNYQFVFEMRQGQTGEGQLYVQELEDEVVPRKGSGKEIVSQPKKGSARLVSGNVGGIPIAANAELLDIVGVEDVRSITNPIFLGTTQNTVGQIDRPNMLYRSSITGDQAKIGLVPSIQGPMENLGDLKRRLAVPGSYLSMGINRINKLLQATFNQMPLLGRTLENVMDKTGFSLKTKPDVFYKQYLSLGLKASKIAGLYLGVRTADHYREKFGLAGNLVASAGVSFGIMKAYEKVAAQATEATRNKLGLLSFGVQMLMPGFDKGILEGIATTGVNLDIGRSYIGKYTGLSHVRRGIEGALPGFTNMTTGLYLGLGAAALSYSGYGNRFVEASAKGSLNIGQEIFKHVDDLMKGRFGFVGDNVALPPSAKDIIKAPLIDALYPSFDKPSDLFTKMNPFAKEILKLGADDARVIEYQSRLDKMLEGKSLENLTSKDVKSLKGFFKNNQELLKSFYGDNLDIGKFKDDLLEFDRRIPALQNSLRFKATKVTNEVNESLLKRIYEINERYPSKDIMSSVGRRLEIFGAEIYHSFFGATMTGEIDIELGGKKTTKKVGGEMIAQTYEEVAKGLNASPIVKRFGALTLGVTLLHQMMTGAFFGMMEDPEELKAIYSGEKLVEVKKGRWWEAGGTPYEGGQTSYFRPHAYHSFMTKAREKSVWGDEVEEYSPLSRFLLKNFTYHLEEKNYYNRPYPMTGAGFEDVPIIGKLLSATIGRVVKPTKLMHEDELYREEGGNREIAFLRGFGSNPSLGEMGPGIPVSPYGGMRTLGAIQYTFREIEGLTGYAKNVMQKLVTGREVLGTREYVMENANLMDSTIESYWSKDLGGFGFMSEPIRRIFPRPRAEIDTYNPIMNSMPSYIPERLKRGDPYRLLPNGYARLPGEGYAALNPDVAGLDPEDYPDIHKYKILADIAPQSRETIRLRQKLMERKIGEALTDHERGIFDDVTEYHQKRLAANRDDVFHENAIKLPFISDTIAGGYLGVTETIRRGSAALENLIPGGFRPSAKLLGHTRDAIETYEYERVYNTSNSFWDAPIRDWFRPAMYSAAHFLGWDGKPSHVKQREDLDAHFDKLQFIKFMKLASNAENPKDKKRFLGLAARTRVGVNPDGDALSMYLSLPTQEKRFFDAFAHAEGSDRERILEMVPEDQTHLYKAVWERMDAGEELSMLSSAKPVINEEYMYSKLKEVSQEMKLGPAPKADWIGWHKDVDMNDIKIKYISSTGEDIHDYDAWASQVRNISRKPYLEDSELFMYNGYGPSRRSLRNSIIRKSATNPLDSSRYLFNTSQGHGETSRAHLNYSDNRGAEMLQMLSQNIRG
jgi:hypothetical protein